MSDIGVYVVHHGAENYPSLENDVVHSIFTGPQGRYGHRFPLRDNSEGYTSPLNPDLYSEFTAVDWIRHKRMKTNQTSTGHDIIGLMHYRSFLNLGDSGKTDPLSRIGMTKSTIENLMDGKDKVDLLTSKPLTEVRGPIRNQFIDSHPLAAEILDKAYNILFYSDQYSRYMYIDQANDGMCTAFNVYFNSNNMPAYFKCLTIARSACFKDYTDFIFFMLDKIYEGSLKKDIDKIPLVFPSDKNFNPLKTRFRLLAFTAERLSAFFIYCAIQSKKYQVKTFDRAHYAKLGKMLEALYPQRDNNKSVPLFRFYCSANNDHFYTANIAEINTLVNIGWEMECCLGYIDTDSNATPIYRAWSLPLNDHFYTNNENEYKNACANGYKAEGIVGYSKAGPGSVPVYRYLLTYGYAQPHIKKDHFYTTNENEVKLLPGNVTVAAEGILCYVDPV
jgi:hypothetical protein